MLIKRWSIFLFNGAVATLIFVVPSNLFLKLSVSSAYVQGLLVDYLIPKLYLSDLVLMAIILIGSYLTFSSFKLKTSPKLAGSLMLSFGIVLTIWQVLSPFPWVGLMQWLRLMLIGLAGWLLIYHRRLISPRLVLAAVSATILFQSGLAIYQFHAQQALIGYPLLGEPPLWPTIGLAKTQLGHLDQILPYGTTAHPNILGGILAVYLLCILSHLWSRLKHTVSFKTAGLTILLGVGSYALLLTQSFSALLTVIFGTIWLIFSRFLTDHHQRRDILLLTVSLLILVATPILINLLTKLNPDNDSFRRRSYLQDAAIQMFIDQPLFGVGLNQFTARVEEYSTNPEIVRFVQPVHHLGLLWLAETGLVGMMFLISFLFFAKKIMSPVTILMVIAGLDHYLVTQQSGLLLVLMTTTVCSGVFKLTQPARIVSPKN